MSYDDVDDTDDFDPAFDGPGGRRRFHPTTAGMNGFIASMVSLGLLAVVAVLYYFLQADANGPPDPDRTLFMMLWFLFLDILSFVGALTATVLAGRGLAPSNPLYRGWALAGLIFGIIEIVITVIFGLFMTCCAVPIAGAMRNVGG